MSFLNFNGIRKQAILIYEDLVDILNSSIIREQDKIYINGHPIGQKKYVLVEVDKITTSLNSLNFLLGVIALAKLDGNEEISDVYSEMFPDGSGKSIKCFEPGGSQQE